MPAPVPPPSARLSILLSAAFWTVAITAAFVVAERWWPPSGLLATTYATTTWSGRPVYTTTDTTLSTELLGNPPLSDLQQYSVEWTGSLVVTDPGRYTFWISSDDGSTIDLDGSNVVDNDGIHADRRESGERELSAGVHDIRIRYFQGGGRYALTTLWGKSGRELQPIPATRLVPGPTTMLAYRFRLLPPAIAFAVTLGAAALLFAALRRSLGGRLAGWHGGRADRLVARVSDLWWALAVVAIVGGGLRLALLETMPPVLWPDSHVFYVTMRNILEGSWRSHDPYRTLVYPYFLAAILGGRETPLMGQVVIALQLLMGLLAAMVFYVVGRRAFTPAVAAAAALLFAGHALQLYYEASVLTESLFTLVLAVTLWAAVRACASLTVGRAATLALLAALLVLVRPVAQWYVVGLLAVGVVAMRRQRRRLVPLAVAAVCYTVPIVWWMSVNQHEYGFFGISLGRGMGLYTRVFDIDRLTPPESSQFPELRELYTFARSQRWSPNRVRDELNYVRGRSSARADDEMYRFSRETVLAHPIAFAAGTLRQWLIQTAAPMNSVRACASAYGPFLCSGRTDDSLRSFKSTPAAPSALRTWLVAYVMRLQVRMDVVTALAALGIVAYVLGGSANAAGALVAMTIAYMTLVPAASQHPQDRFRLPIDCLLFMCAAYGVRAIARRWPLARQDPTA